jgi:beta-lactamase regulating signal transducer with metallopeptidase domain
MSTETITLLNFIVHSLVIGGAAWLLVRFVIRDAMRRCILANLAVLMCLYSPFDISMRDLFPPQRPVPVWTPLRETFEADWRVTVAPVTMPVVMAAAPAPTWDVNDVVKSLRWLAWLVTAALLLRLLIQSIRVQRWAWRLRDLTQAEIDSLPKDVRFERMSVFEGDGTPCVAGWFFPVIAVPSTAFEKLTPQQWQWLIRHESEHLRCHDTVAVLLQNIVRAFLWWNPFIHALIEEYARAREEACDAAAVGEDRAHDDYAEFLLAWAAKAAPQPSCVMPIAHSRPARRLKARLVALMEARGVRKKLGALFLLGCAAFAVLAPFFAASFGIATASAQPAKSSDKAARMFTRIYRVGPDFLADADTVRSKLEKQGITFPLASGETLLLQLETSKKPLTVLLTAQALDPSGKEISSFDGVRPGASARSQIVAAAAADKQASEWAVRVYKVPAGFAQDKPPLEVLKAAGITFPKAADAMLKDGKLTVRNTKANLELIEAWIDALNKVEVKKSVHLSVLAAEMKGDFLKLLNDWLPPLPGAAKNTEAPTVITEPPPPAVLRQFILSGIFTQPQFEKVVKSLADSGAKLESLKPNPNPKMYVLPAAVGGQEMKIEPIIGPDGNTIELIIRTPSQDQNPARGISTSVTIWDGQTVVLGSQASEGVSRFLFITSNLIAPLAKK